MAARTRKGTYDKPWDDSVRQKIQTSMLINRLQDHVLGKIELVATQVTAALGLIRKTVPDLAVTEHKGTVNLVRAEELSDNELAGYIGTDSSEGTAQTPLDPSKLN